MKYLAMICRGHVPVWKGRINRDAKNFMRYFLPPGTTPNQASIGKAIRHLHLAFKSMETEEIYEVLMEQFLRAAAKYDPHYSDKVKEVVEVIENALSGSPFFGAVDVDRHLEFRCHRYLRLLCRRGFPVAATGREGKCDGSPAGPELAREIVRPTSRCRSVPTGLTISGGTRSAWSICAPLNARLIFPLSKPPAI